MLRANAVRAPRFVRRSTWLTPSRRPVLGSILSGVYGQAVLVFTGVVIARALGPTDRGHLAFILLLESVVRQIGGLGLPAATAFFIARNRAQEYGVVQAVRTPAILQAALLTLVQAVLLWIFVAGQPEQVWLAGLLTLALMPSILGMEYGLAILQGQGRFFAFNVLRALPVSGYGVIIALLFVTGKAGLISIVIAYLLPNAIFTCVLLYVGLRGVRPTGRREDLPSRRQIFSFGVRGYLGGLSPIEAFRLDQATIGLFLGAKALGLYVVALSFMNFPRLMAASVGAIAFPRVAQDNVSGRRTMWRFTLFITGLMVIVIVPLELTAGWLVPLFFGSDFEGAVPVMRILLIGAFFYSIRRVLADGAKGLGFPGLGSIAELGSWISLVPLLAILMPRFGLEGAGAASTISSAFSLVILVWALLRTRDHRVPPADTSGSFSAG